MNDKATLLKRIVVNSQIMVGKPTIAGTRLTVQHVLGLLAQGMSIQEILDEYKGLEREDVLACLFFATEALENTAFVPLTK